MSDENESAASSPAENHVPLSRLNEEITKRRELEQQLQFSNQQTMMLSQLVQQHRAPAAAPVQDDPELEQIKEHNPALYQRLKKAEANNRSLSAGLYQVNDRADRVAFVQEFGDLGKKRLAEVERILDNERRRTNGRTSADRAGILRWMLGEERIRSESQGAPAPRAPAPQSSAPIEQAAPVYSAPPSDPSFAAPASSSTAGKGLRGLTHEDREKELENVVF